MRRTVLVVDDHAAFLDAACTLLAAEGFDVVGRAATGAAAVALAALLHPAVVLLDVRLPDISGFEAAARLDLLVPPPQVVLVSSLSVAEVRPRLAASTAIAFLPKSELSGSALRQLLEAW